VNNCRNLCEQTSFYCTNIKEKRKKKIYTFSKSSNEMSR